MKNLKLFVIDAGEKSPNIIGYAEREDVAKSIAKGRGFWGSDAGVYENEFKIYESEQDYLNEKTGQETKQRENIKKSALNKLTKTEKEVLGLL